MRVVSEGPLALDEVLEAWAGGAVVALPTDTVYGLAAPLSQPAAVASLFDVKGRPEGLALPVLVHGADQVGAVAATWPPAAVALASQWWPGPLTLVVPSTALTGPLVGGDGHTVGVRCPDHRFVRSLCQAAGPLAVTSANPHGERPCRTVAEVVDTIDHTAVALIVDGGTCDGVPSTVADCTVDPVRCLRPGGVAWESIEALLRA